MTYAAFACPDNYATQTKTKLLSAPTVRAAFSDLFMEKVTQGDYELLAYEIEPDESAADVALSKSGAIYLFTIEKE